jgi:erythronate-4-phosphate dehydrogenase
MKVLLNDPPRQRKEGPDGFVELSTLLKNSDIITLHVPLNRSGMDRTWHMVDDSFLNRVKKGALLINTSRGEVVDETALLKGKHQRRVSEVVLDVFESEPDIHPEWLDLATLVTPHIAGYSIDGKANGTTASVRAVSRFFDLGLDQWEPAAIPAPSHAEILADTAGKKPLEVLWEIYRQTYDVSADDRRLRADPAAFENLRGNYPFRREPTAYAVRLFQGYEEIISILETLGFSVLGDYCA